MRSRLRCRLCGEVIGTYEPLIVVLGGRPQRTSLAAEPSLTAGAAGEAYHGDCYEARSPAPG